MRRETPAERAAWTEHVTGEHIASERPTKYGNKRVQFNGRWYDSKKEAEHARSFQGLASRGLITEYEEQKPIVLVPGYGKLRPIVYVADFAFRDGEGRYFVYDAKGFKTKEYRLKKRMAALLLGLEITEI